MNCERSIAAVSLLSSGKQPPGAYYYASGSHETQPVRPQRATRVERARSLGPLVKRQVRPHPENPRPATQLAATRTMAGAADSAREAYIAQLEREAKRE